MPSQLSPGQCAYEAWRVVLMTHPLQHWLPYVYATWHVLQPLERRAWEAAAQAVRARQEEEPCSASD